MMQALTLLNGLSPQQFMAEYWQKKPLLIRNAIPGFKGLLDANALAGLACDTDVPSRLVSFDPDNAWSGNGWQVRQGPFEDAVFASLPDSHWTLLVQGVNHVLPEAQALLRQFNFIPQARLDDLMVSYAPSGGGVGPHVDSYDVFLLQGAGRRRWRISQQHDRQLIPDAPLRILSNFVCEEEWVLEAGDMLYLPPNVAHWGIAEDDECMTYSIGFRAPAARELAIEFLDECRQAGMHDQLYADPDLLAVEDTAAIDDHMVAKVKAMLQQLSWPETELGPFLARYFSEPKSYVVFTPHRKLSLDKFSQRATQSGVVLDLQTQLLHWQQQYFINGEAVNLNTSALPCLNRLANTRALTAQECQLSEASVIMPWLHEVFLAGYLHFPENTA